MAFFRLNASKGEESFAFQCNLKPPAYKHVSFEHFKRGIDNVRIDVQISGVLGLSIKRLSRDVIERAIENSKGRKTWEQVAQPPSSRLLRFQKAYFEMMSKAIHQAKQTSDHVLPWLARAATIAYILQQVKSELNRATMRLKEQARGSSGGVKLAGFHAKAAGMQAKSVWLAKYQQRLYSFLVGMLFQQMSATETGDIAKRRLALLNESDADSVKFLAFNPLLRAESPDTDELMIAHYLLLPWPGDEAEAFQELNEFLDAIFLKIMPDDAESFDVFSPTTAPFLQQFFGENTKSCLLDWRDNPENIALIFDTLSPEDLGDALDDCAIDWQREILNADNPVRKNYYDFLLKNMKSASILSSVEASYSIMEAYKKLGNQLPFRLIFYYLLGGKKQKEAKQRIQGLGSADTSLPAREMYSVLDQVRPREKSVKGLVLRFLHDFISYRRDLKIWAAMQSLIGQIHLLEGDEDIRLATINRSVYIFQGADEQESDTSEIDGHVIIKADVRGSVGITTELREQGLNPATHFSRTFFDPISELLPQYDVEKVFVEGDAVILSVMEYSTSEQRTAVARACGLSRKIIQIVERHNQKNRKNGLPVLELGIGIVYRNDAPTFLYDGDHKITISPAIGRSDRLSSCSKVVRPVLEAADDHDAMHHIDVFALSEDEGVQNDKGEAYLRYNVNGIELDIAAFGKLRKEIALRAANIHLLGGKGVERYIIGQFPDAEGYVHTLAVRQGIVRLWNEEQALRKPLKRFYFEVIADDERYQTFVEMVKTS